MLSFSLKAVHAAKGTRTGIREMITAPVVELTFVKPKLSPIKYRKGLKKASRMNHRKSDFDTILKYPENKVMLTRIMEDMRSRKKTILKGGKISFACLNHMKEKLHKIMAVVIETYIIGFTGFINRDKLN